MFNWFDELKASIESGIKSGIESGCKIVGDSLKAGMENMFQMPEAAEPFRLIRVFRPAIDRTIAQDGIKIEEDSWKIEAYKEKDFILFDIPEPNIQECLVMCRAKVKTAHLYKPASLFIKGTNNSGWTYRKTVSIEGTNDWHLCQVIFHYKRSDFSKSLGVGIEFESGGEFWLKDVEILQAAVKEKNN